MSSKQQTFSKAKRTTARRTKEPLPDFIEITPPAFARGVKVGLENTQGIEQNCQGQPP